MLTLQSNMRETLGHYMKALGEENGYIIDNDTTEFVFTCFDVVMKLHMPETARGLLKQALYERMQETNGSFTREWVMHVVEDGIGNV